LLPVGENEKALIIFANPKMTVWMLSKYAQKIFSKSLLEFPAIVASVAACEAKAFKDTES